MRTFDASSPTFTGNQRFGGNLHAARVVATFIKFVLKSLDHRKFQLKSLQSRHIRLCNFTKHWKMEAGCAGDGSQTLDKLLSETIEPDKVASFHKIPFREMMFAKKFSDFESIMKSY